MTVCGQEFSPQVLQRLQQTVEADPFVAPGSVPAGLRVVELAHCLGTAQRSQLPGGAAEAGAGREDSSALVCPAVVAPPRRVQTEPAPPPVSPVETSLEALQPVKLGTN